MTDLVHRAAASCAGAYRQWAVRTGHPARLWTDLSVNDLGLGGEVPLDSASLLGPLRSDADWQDRLDRVRSFFAGRPGGPIQIWSAWPTPLPDGWRMVQIPGMVRPAGGDVPGPPGGLEVSPARDSRDFADAARLIDQVFDARAPDPAALVSDGLLGDDWEIFLGRVEGVAVATATAFVSHGFCGVYAVATGPSARGLGYGEAVTWRATLFRPDLPAALQASAMGFPIYQRMGYQEFGRFHLLMGPRIPRADLEGALA